MLLVEQPTVGAEKLSDNANGEIPKQSNSQHAREYLPWKLGKPLALSKGAVMTQIDEPNLDELRQLLYSHSFAVETYPKDFVLRINEKGIDDILQAIKALIATQIQEARIDELEIIDDKLYDINTVDWGEPTKGSIEEWGENHADLYAPTRDVHKVVADRLAQLRSTPNE